MSARCIPTTVRNIQTLWMTNSRRQFQTSILRLSADTVHIKDDGDFQKQVIDSKKSFIVDFHAVWCGPCKILEPRLDKVLTNYNKKVQNTSADQQIKLAKVDIDELGELSSKYNVQAVPTVLAIKNGKEITRFTGVVDENRIQKMIDQLSR
ncbi:unnamed protein product [Rotaria sordida]|uniref:Thioredoxin domain-containing protein n=1 Tax=Rotaria sordida TaxID=392033 RepID=A0A814YCK4_9BILA|nr:unnamed protein product [Rotaria sordida]CAF1295624.1 unnamed protein product [Rotaria sordida]CAF3742614.1 unnamed protein product [Rotaria sordida]CAF3991298.1 unnamed protein product [Rotaria sordida]